MMSASIARDFAEYRRGPASHQSRFSRFALIIVESYRDAALAPAGDKRTISRDSTNRLARHSRRRPGRGPRHQAPTSRCRAARAPAAKQADGSMSPYLGRPPRARPIGDARRSFCSRAYSSLTGHDLTKPSARRRSPVGAAAQKYEQVASATAGSVTKSMPPTLALERVCVRNFGLSYHAALARRLQGAAPSYDQAAAFSVRF